jgi:hypothetical protein
MHAPDPAPRRGALLCISPSFSPDTTPTAIRAGQLLDRLSAQWEITVLTESRAGDAARVRVQVVRSRRPVRLIAALRRLRMEKLLELLVWPDESVFWMIPAVQAGRRAIAERAPSAIVAFMMPYSGGLAGVILSRLSGLPLILNLDDSPTCSDMHPSFPTRLHYRLARALEDLYVRRADAVVYVSQTNLEAVGSRQRERASEKLHLVRYGADPAPPGTPAEPTTNFEIAYVGAMSGWWTLIGHGTSESLLTRVHGTWNRLGRHQLTVLDQRTSSPAVLGAAILDAIEQNPAWAGRVSLSIHGNPYPPSVVQRAIEAAGVDEVVSVHGPVAHAQVSQILARADLLFLTLPKRVDGTRGGRISAKTYEYLATDRPILAAVPQGENWDYLAGKPGVWLVDPDDRARISEIICELAEAKFSGAPRRFERASLAGELSYDVRADEFAAVIRAAIEARSSLAGK